jgi:hypothetical protein
LFIFSQSLFIKFTLLRAVMLAFLLQLALIRSMLNYSLPLETAQSRLGVGENNAGHFQRQAEEARRRTFGLRHASLAITEALRESSVERRIGRPRHLSSTPREIAAGAVLCERFAVGPGRSEYTLTGLLHSETGQLAAYSAAIPSNKAPQQYGADAWGNRERILPFDHSRAGVLVCRQITSLDLGGDLAELDRQVGAIAAPLTLDDLYAGLSVRRCLTIPEAVVPDPA